MCIVQINVAVKLNENLTPYLEEELNFELTL